ncbi:rod shape-determining protein MreC [Anaplasma bovis]|uniref:rod shape-determining protein MreC n=1 Tax=Anaplasma bovis TaxID=186733 RepID=UPI002FEE66E4
MLAVEIILYVRGFWKYSSDSCFVFFLLLIVKYRGIRLATSTSYRGISGAMRVLLRKRVALCIVVGVAVCCFDPLGKDITGGVLGTISDYSVHAVKRVTDLLKGQSQADYHVYCPNTRADDAFTATDDSAALSPCGERINSIVGENEKLKQMLNFLSDYSNLSYLTTRALVFYDGVKENVLIPAGLTDGIKKGQVVVNSEGLVGKVVEVWDRRAKVLLLTDKEFQMEVSVVDNGLRAIVRGSDNGLVLSGVEQAGIKNGSLVVTAGDEEDFPYGVYVGHVDNGERVITKLNPRTLNIVSVLMK